MLMKRSLIKRGDGGFKNFRSKERSILGLKHHFLILNIILFTLSLLPESNWLPSFVEFILMICSLQPSYFFPRFQPNYYPPSQQLSWSHYFFCLIYYRNPFTWSLCIPYLLILTLFFFLILFHDSVLPPSLPSPPSPAPTTFCSLLGSTHCFRRGMTSHAEVSSWCLISKSQGCHWQECECEGVQILESTQDTPYPVSKNKTPTDFFSLFLDP